SGSPRRGSRQAGSEDSCSGPRVRTKPASSWGPGVPRRTGRGGTKIPSSPRPVSASMASRARRQSIPGTKWSTTCDGPARRRAVPRDHRGGLGHAVRHHREKRCMRAIWTGSIAFGLVNIPIELHRAIRETRPHFRLLHAKDKSPVRFDRVCEREDRSVTWSEVVKGYEYTKGKFVVLTQEDLQRAALEKTRTFDILHFVSGAAVDDRFFETPYYSVPTRGGERAYVVLREALRQAEKMAVGKIMLRETQHLAALE